MQEGPENSEDFVGFVDILAFIWKGRFGLLIGCSLGVIAALGYLIIDWPSQVAQVVVAVDPLSLPAIEKDLVNQFNSRFSNPDLQRALINSVSAELVNLSKEKIRVLGRGRGVVELAPTSGSSFLKLKTTITLNGKSDALIFVERLNEQIDLVNKEHFEILAPGIKDSVKELMELDSAFDLSGKDYLTDSYKKASENRVKVRDILEHLSKLNNSSSGFDKSGIISNEIVDDYLFNKAFLELENTRRSGSISPSKYETIRTELADAKIELDYAQASLLPKSYVVSELQGALKSLKESLLKGLDPRLNKMPHFSLIAYVPPDQVRVDAKEILPILLLIGAATSVGAFVGLIINGIYLYIHKNWTQITASDT